MNQKIQQIFLLIGSVCMLLLAAFFFTRAMPIEAEAVALTQEMVSQKKTQQELQEQKRQTAEAGRRKAELEDRMSKCVESSDCVIVDRDPCGCLKGPGGVMAINVAYMMEFSSMMEKQFKGTVSCPTVASEERECSSTSRPVCSSHGRCKIVY